MKLLISTLFLSLAFFNSYTFASPFPDTSLCQENLEKLPILQNGRVKPLYVHAGELLKYLTGKSVSQATTVYCQLSHGFLGLPSKNTLEMVVEHDEARKLLKMESKELSLDKLTGMTEDLRLEWMKAPAESSLKKTLGELLSKSQIYQQITSGQNWMLYAPVAATESASANWISFEQYVTQLRQSDLLSSESLREKVLASNQLYVANAGDLHLLELRYAKARLPLIGLLLSIIALAILFLAKKYQYAFVAIGPLWIVQLVLLTLRIMISGRAPITNMYETVLFSGFGALTLALGVGHFTKNPRYLQIGVIYDFLTLMMLNFSGGMLSASIGPLVPVLRDNFWLSTHVTSVILSYGALALSWIVANQLLLKARFKGLTKSELKEGVDSTYTCIKFGIVLLAGGIILGGVWADYSWGRFWGWDPKETWSLIALCIYMAILHGKYTQWIPNQRFISFTAAAFMSIMMAWFGVNYILATGLHSYGFSEGGAVFLGSLFLIQAVIILFTHGSLKAIQNE
jgi:cytochrome c-type biogenesis protein CcsB